MAADLGLEYATTPLSPARPPEFGVSLMRYGLCAAAGYVILALTLAVLFAAVRGKRTAALPSAAGDRVGAGRSGRSGLAGKALRLLLDLSFLAALFLVFAGLFSVSYYVLWSAVGRGFYQVSLSFRHVSSIAALFMFVAAPAAFLAVLARNCLADRLAGRAASVLPAADRLPAVVRRSAIFAVAAVLLLGGAILLLSPLIISLNQPGL